MIKKKVKFLSSECLMEKTNRHFDRSDMKHREAEKSVQKQISRLAFGSLEMTNEVVGFSPPIRTQ
jgi:hypothetical protein